MIEWKRLTPAQKIELRYRAKSDLYWLATEVLDNKDFVEHLHRPMCDLFVKKKPGLSLAQQDTVKERMMLVSRGHFKTTVDEADIIQWILLDPNVRILILSGKEDIVLGMVKNIKDHFQTNPKLRLLFPELCPPADKDFGNTTQFTSPGRTKRLREPTVLGVAGQAVKAGLHFDVIKGDDLVNEQNSATIDLIRKTKQRWTYTKPIVEPYGYRDLIGTPYDEDDLYAHQERSNPGLALLKIPVWVYKDEKATVSKLKRGGKLVADDVILRFPERFTFDWLISQRHDDPYIFNCQYLMNPTPEDMATFTEEMMEKHRINPFNIPKSGVVFQRWDLGFSEEKYSDFSVCATGMYDAHGILYILDIAIMKVGPHDLVRAVVTQALKWRPSRIGIEDAAGSKLILPALEQKLRELGRSFPFDWFKTSPKKNKRETIAGLEPLLQEHKLYFSLAIPERAWDETKKQFVKFPKYKHDDAPDAIAGLLQYRGAVDTIPDPNPDDEEPLTYHDGDYFLGYGLNGG